MMSDKPAVVPLVEVEEDPAETELQRLRQELAQVRRENSKLTEWLERAQRQGRLICWDWDAEKDALDYAGSLEAIGLTGYVAGAGLERFLEFVHPEDAEKLRSAYAEADRSGTGYELDYRFKNQDGETVLIHEVAEVVKDNAGSVIAHRGIIQDVTEVDRERKELREREAWLEQAQEFAGIGYWIWDGEQITDWTKTAVKSGKATHFSEECRKILAIQEDESGIHSAGCHPDDEARCQAAWYEAERELKGYDVEYRLEHEDGSIGYVRAVGQPSRDPVSGKIRWCGIVQDIGPSKDIESELRESRQRFQDILESTTDWVWETDAELRFTYLSDRFQRLSGLDSERFMGKRRWEVAERLPSEDVWIAHQADMEAHRPVRNFRYPYRDVEGNRRFVSVSGNPVYNQDGSFAGYRGTATDVTAEMEAQEALEQSEARLAKAAALARLGYWVWDHREDRPIYGSSEFLKAYGFESEEDFFARVRVPKDMLGLIHPDDREAHARAIRHSLDTGEEMDREARALRPDGTVRHLRIVAERIKDPSGKIQRSHGAIQDITEAKEIRLELDRSRAVLQSALDQMPAGVVIADAPDGRVRLANPAAIAFRGNAERISIDADDGRIASDEAMARAPGSEFEHIELLLARALYKGRSSRNMEGIVHRSDGEQRRLLASAAPIRNRLGQVIAGIVVFSDITEQAEAEDALRRSEERYKTIFDGIPVAVLEVDWSEAKQTLDALKADGVEDLAGYLTKQPETLSQIWDGMRVLTQNAAALSLYDVEDESSLTQFFDRWELQDDPDLQRFVADCLAELSKGNRTYVGEVEHLTASGGRAWVRLYVRIPEAYRETWGRVLVLEEDQTKRRRAEEQLLQAQKMEAVGQLTGGVAHDFNNVLGIILGNLELLGEAVAASGRTESLRQSAIRAAERGAGLTQRLLAFSRKQPLKPQVVEIGRLVESVRGLAARALGESIEIVVQHGRELWHSYIDAGQLESALLNLAINARDAMPEGGRLTIETANVAVENGDGVPSLEPGEFVQIRVTDSGCGIAPDMLEHVFEPFFTTKDVGKGSGLGLSMVYGFVKQSGGHVEIESEVGVGTSVSLYLPRYQGGDAAAEDVLSYSQIPDADGETILVVEDDQDLREMARSTLEKLGYTTLEAPTAEAAFATLRSGSEIDLLLTDIVLPGGVNGRQLAKEARSLRPALPILFMSGYSQDSAEPGGGSDGESELIQKPFRTFEIAAAVRRALGKAE